MLGGEGKGSGENGADHGQIAEAVVWTIEDCSWG